MPLVTRIAPTPSGFLHPGNAANAVLVRRLADAIGAQVLLRIDDLDAVRARPEYVDDIFGVLDWLGIAWDLGPRDADDFHAHYALPTQLDRLTAARHEIVASGMTFACACSRTDLARSGSRRCVSGCASRSLPLESGRTALRLHVPDDTVIEVDGVPVDVGATAGDAVIWRRDGLPAYHLASVVADRDAGITHVVRGDDLRESTALQLHIAPLLHADGLLGATWLHHPLLLADDGTKLSKSTNASGEPMPRTDEMRAHVHALADELGRDIDRDIVTTR